MINDILDLSKIEAGRLELHFENFAAGTAQSEVLSVVQPLAAAKHIEVANELEMGFVISADRVRFKQILYNLLSNAVKFTRDGGKMWVALSHVHQSRPSW